MPRLLSVSKTKSQQHYDMMPSQGLTFLLLTGFVTFTVTLHFTYAGYVKKLDTYSSGSSISRYSTLSAAKDACNVDNNCYVVYDVFCDEKDYVTETKGTLSPSISGSCVWLKEVPTVSCGNHNANSCYGCPQGNGANWCNGECTWDYSNSVCIHVDSTVNCGDHMAVSCYQCPQGNGASWCNGDCTWDIFNSVCAQNV